MPRLVGAKVASDEPHARLEPVAGDIASCELEAHLLRFDADERELRPRPRDREQHRAEAAAQIACARRMRAGAITERAGGQRVHRVQGLVGRQHVVERITMAAHALPDAIVSRQRIVRERIVGPEHRQMMAASRRKASMSTPLF